MGCKAVAGLFIDSNRNVLNQASVLKIEQSFSGKSKGELIKLEFDSATPLELH